MKTVYSGNIKLTALTLDPMLQGRVTMNKEQIEAYADAMRDGVQFPPILVAHVEETDHYYVVDGWHRVEAARSAGLQEINASFAHGTYHDAFIAALGANATHGLPRTNADKNRIAQLALMDPEISKLSDRKIAELLGLSQPFVSKIRASLKQGDNGYQPTEFSKLNLTMDEIGHVIIAQNKAHWIAIKEARKTLREGLIAGDQSTGYRATKRGAEYIAWLKENGHERQRFEIAMFEFARRTNDPRYFWNHAWEELERLWRARGWKGVSYVGSINALINAGYVLMERIGDDMWVHISPAGCDVIGAQRLDIAPLPSPRQDGKPVKREQTPDEINHEALETYNTRVKWTRERAKDGVSSLTKGYWCKDCWELYPDLKLAFERAQRELMELLNAAQPVPFVPPILEPEFDADAAFEAIAGD